MTLYVVFDDGKHREWHVGESFDMPNSMVRRVDHVQADGDELIGVESRFSNLPKAYGVRVVTWWGDHARFIASNLGK